MIINKYFDIWIYNLVSSWSALNLGSQSAVLSFEPGTNNNDWHRKQKINYYPNVLSVVIEATALPLEA